MHARSAHMDTTIAAVKRHYQELSTSHAILVHQLTLPLLQCSISSVNHHLIR
jgi:hypothetical protein